MNLYAGGYLDSYLPHRRSKIIIELGQPTNLTDVLTRIGIPAAEVLLVVINGQLVELQDAVVSDQDDVKLYPAVSGG
jgi:sulfur carrier protein ThiS